MKQAFFVVLLSFYSLVVHGQDLSLRNMSDKDTVTINYSIALGETGSVHEGIILVKEDGRIKATHVVYNFGVMFLPNGIMDVANDSFVPMIADSVKAFYSTFRNDYTVLKDERTLNDDQVNFLNNFIKEAENFESQGFSNAPEYYYIINSDKELIILDRSGNWNKNKEFREVQESKESGQDINSKPITIKPDQIVIKLDFDRKVNSWGSKNKNQVIKFRISDPMLDTIKVNYIQDYLTVNLLDSSFEFVPIDVFKKWNKRPTEERLLKSKNNKNVNNDKIIIKRKRQNFTIFFSICWTKGDKFKGYVFGYSLKKGINYVSVSIKSPDEKKILKGMIPLIVN